MVLGVAVLSGRVVLRFVAALRGLLGGALVCVLVVGWVGPGGVSGGAVGGFGGRGGVGGVVWVLVVGCVLLGGVVWVLVWGSVVWVFLIFLVLRWVQRGFRGRVLGGGLRRLISRGRGVVRGEVGGWRGGGGGLCRGGEIGRWGRGRMVRVWWRCLLVGC